MADFSHLTQSGEGTMVDISTKVDSARVALVSGQVRVSEECAEKLKDSVLEEIIRTARIAAISAAKQTSQLIPYCHQVPLSKVDLTVSFENTTRTFHILSTTKTTASTGVEMEAFVSAQIAGLTIYDMIKAVDPAATVGPFSLREKSGGKKGLWKNNSPHH